MIEEADCQCGKSVDTPGDSLAGRKLTITALKRYNNGPGYEVSATQALAFSCIAAPTKGRKVQLVQR